MAKITKIEQQKKRTDRYSIYIDDKFALGLSEYQLVELGLVSGQELSSHEVEELEVHSTFGKAYDRCLGLLSRRPRSEKEIRDYLKRKGREDELADQIVTKLYGASLLDDGKFAKEWVNWRMMVRPRSRRHLRMELRQKGISQEQIDEALVSLSDDAELAQLIELIEKKRRRYDSEQKLIAYLARQGYDYDMIRCGLDDMKKSDG